MVTAMVLPFVFSVVRVQGIIAAFQQSVPAFGSKPMEPA